MAGEQLTAALTAMGNAHAALGTRTRRQYEGHALEHCAVALDLAPSAHEVAVAQVVVGIVTARRLGRLESDR